MADDRLREAERTFQETASIEDEARLLTERARAGLLASERLELAAELRYEPAVVALGGPNGPRSHSLPVVVEGIERFGLEVVVRAALVVARRSVALWSRPLGATEECLAAIDAWLTCPCEQHRAQLEQDAFVNVHLAARYALDAALGRKRYSKVQWFVNVPREPDAVLVAAIRQQLARWALAPHELRQRVAPTRGELLDLRLKFERGGYVQRLLVSSDRIRVGEDRRSGIQLDFVSGADLEFTRLDGGFEVTDLETDQLFVNEERTRRAALATGDVITACGVSIEVHVASASSSEDLRAASDRARRLAPGADEDQRRLVRWAAAAGDLGAILAASEAGIQLRPRPDVVQWVQTLDDLAPGYAAAAALRLATEAQAAWSRAFPEETVNARALAAGAAWLRSRTRSAAEVVDAHEQELRKTLERLWTERRRDAGRVAPTVDSAAVWRALAAGSATYGFLGVIRDGRELVTATRGAVDAGLPLERARAVIEEEILRNTLPAE
ncbi:MAG TPA: FHA domain-containing protein [Planctomycetota bacterium]|nr:FHA domain-containing protein [Planctomycetota bacterium]